MSAQTPSRQTPAHETESASYKVGYRNPPRHTQFRKGRSGNPGGRPRRGEAERLKAITFQEAFRGVLVKENGVMQPVLAIQAVMRRQVELAMEGNVHAQRDLLRAVRTYERDDAEKAAIEEYVEELVRQAADLEEGLLAAKRAAQTPAKKTTYVEAAQRIRELLRLDQPKNSGEAGDPGAAETDAEQETAEEPEEREPQRASAPAVPPSASQPAAEPPADPQPPTRTATISEYREMRDKEPRRPSAVGRKAELGAVFHPPQHGAHLLGATTPVARAALPTAAGRRRSKGEPAAANGNAEVPDKVAVLRDSGRRSKRAARRQRGRSG